MGFIFYIASIVICCISMKKITETISYCMLVGALFIPQILLQFGNVSALSSGGNDPGGLTITIFFIIPVYIITAIALLAIGCSVIKDRN